MKLFRIGFVLSILVPIAAFAAAACSSNDDNDNNTTGAPAATTKAASSGSPSASGGATSLTVVAKDFSFTPDTFKVAAGKEVTITLNNTGNVSHTLTVYTDEVYTDAVDGADTDFVSAGDTGEFKGTFAAGEYYFRCEVHPSQMQGEFQAE